MYVVLCTTTVIVYLQYTVCMYVCTLGPWRIPVGFAGERPRVDTRGRFSASLTLSALLCFLLASRLSRRPFAAPRRDAWAPADVFAYIPIIGMYCTSGPTIPLPYVVTYTYLLRIRPRDIPVPVRPRDAAYRTIHCVTRATHTVKRNHSLQYLLFLSCAVSDPPFVKDALEHPNLAYPSHYHSGTFGTRYTSPCFSTESVRPGPTG